MTVILYIFDVQIYKIVDKIVRKRLKPKRH